MSRTKVELPRGAPGRDARGGAANSPRNRPVLLTHLRISRAKELLRRGVRASDVASLVGIYDQAQLTRHFRRSVGTTPARYGKMASEAALFGAS